VGWALAGFSLALARPKPIVSEHWRRWWITTPLVAAHNLAKDKLMHGFFMTPQNWADLVAFVVSLTDEGVTTDENFTDPWPREHR
jgi:hypothetical protein